MTVDDEQSRRAWQAALMTALADAIEHLQVLIFDEGWDDLRAVSGSDEVALRESVATYERELARLFGFLRTSGALRDGVAWSTLKVDLRRAALDTATEISLRTALESGFYAAESIPLGDHDAYLHWSAALRGFLASYAASHDARPGPDASEIDRLQWAYTALAGIEEHDAFNRAFVDWIDVNPAGKPESAAIVEHQLRLLSLPRYDLILNAGLRWLSAVNAG